MRLDASDALIEVETKAKGNRTHSKLNQENFTMLTASACQLKFKQKKIFLLPVKCIRSYIDCDNQPCLHSFDSSNRILFFFSIFMMMCLRPQSIPGTDGGEKVWNVTKEKQNTKTEQSAPVENLQTKQEQKQCRWLWIFFNAQAHRRRVISESPQLRFFVVLTFPNKMLVSRIGTHPG